MTENNDERYYQILINDEGQYSLWPEFKNPPAGWQQTGPAADKPTCLEWIEAHWTDLRPRHLREAGG